jgi:hypothetical protein
MSERRTPLTPRHRLAHVFIAWLVGMVLAIGIFFAALIAIFAFGAHG